MLAAGIALAAVALVGLVVWLIGARDTLGPEPEPLAQPDVSSLPRSVSPDDVGVFRTELRARYEAQLREQGQVGQA